MSTIKFFIVKGFSLKIEYKFCQAISLKRKILENKDFYTFSTDFSTKMEGISYSIFEKSKRLHFVIFKKNDLCKMTITIFSGYLISSPK